MSERRRKSNAICAPVTSAKVNSDEGTGDWTRKEGRKVPLARDSTTAPASAFLTATAVKNNHHLGTGSSSLLYSYLPRWENSARLK